MKTLANVRDDYEHNFNPTLCDILGTVSAQYRANVNEAFSCQLMPVRDKWVAWIYDGEEQVAYIPLKDTWAEACSAAYNLRNEYVEAALEGVYLAAVNDALSLQQEITCAPSTDSYR